MQTSQETLINETSDLLDEIIPILNKYIHMLKDDVNPQGGALQYLLKQEIETLDSLIQRTQEVKESVKRHLKPETPIEPPRSTVPTRRHAGDLTVIMEDGQKICHSRVSETFVEVIEKIGVEKVKTLGIIINALPLIDTFKHPTYNQAQSGSYYIMTNSDTDKKIEQLKEIKRSLNLNFKVIDNRKGRL